MIYYIYKVRRKQTSIRSSRSVLTHRYLRYISWISWEGGHRPPQAGFFHPVPQPAHASFSRRCLYPKAAIAAALSLPLSERQSKRPPIFPPRKREITFFPFPTYFSRVAPLILLCPRFLTHTTRGPSAAGHRPLLRPSHKQKNAGPRHCAANPQKCRLLAQENARRHAWLSRSCFGRVVFQQRRPAFTPALFPFSFFYKGKEKRKQKQIQQVRIHRSDSLRSSSRCTRLAPRLVR